MAVINFFTEGTRFQLEQPRKTASWIKRVILSEKATPQSINFIFCSDKALLRRNMEYLSHSTLTDIITFDNSEVEGEIEGDIFISVDRVKENALKFDQPFDRELHRVIIHGVLHLLGYNDKSAKQKAAIRKKEDACLSLR
jgi:probable rRNA maturation factor